MRTDLLAAFGNRDYWNARFSRDKYPQALDEYIACHGQTYLQAVSQAGEDGITALADELLDGIAAVWRRTLFWKRSVVKADTKEMAIRYLSPMLMELSPECMLLAQCLRDQWEKRWPNDAYQVADRRRIQRGFRPAGILGALGFVVQEKNPDEK